MTLHARAHLLCTLLGLVLPLNAIAQANSALSLSGSPSPLVSSSRQSETPTDDSAKRLDGRLFFSPLERQRIDSARKRGIDPVNDEQLSDGQAPILNGFVKRSDGNTVVWVDGNLRWNARTAGTSSLAPIDVGGPASYLKATSENSTVQSPKRVMRAKPLVKTRGKKSTRHRVLRPR